MNGRWWNISYFNFDFNSNFNPDFACKFFGHKTGMLITDTGEERMKNLIFSFSCPKNITSFKNCSIQSHYHVLLGLKYSKLYLLCSNVTLSCLNVGMPDYLTLEKFFGKCYYIFDLKRHLNYDEVEKFCLEKNLNMISISTKEQAHYIFNKIIFEKFKSYRHNNVISDSKYMEGLKKETFIPLSKIARCKNIQ